MISRRIFLYRLYVVTNIAIIWVFFSLIIKYNIIAVDNKLLEGRSVGMFSVAFAIIGLIIAGAEAFFLKNAFHRLPFWLSVILRMSLTFILFVAVSIVFLLAYFIFRYDGSFYDFTRVFLDKIMTSTSYLMLMIDLGLLAFISIVLLEVIDKYGPGGVRNLLRGRYNKPRKEIRIFVFLDINESTSIAEKIGHEKYFNMLRDFFADITEPILTQGGHIYQYVGDEIVLSWKNSYPNKLRCLKFIQQATLTFKKKEDYYLKQYNVFPTFKAGIHAGPVTAGYIGIIKKDLVFSGDTLNVTARIRSKCHELKQPFIISEYFLRDFDTPAPFKVQEIGEMTLKGRVEKEKLYSVSFE